MVDPVGISAVVVFYLIVLGVGIWAGRKNKRSKDGQCSSEEIMLAGRNIGYVIGAITLTATWVDGGYIIGTAEIVFRGGNNNGLVWCQAPFGYALSLILGGLFFAKKMRSAGYVTMLDPFERKFGSKMTSLLFLPALLGEVCWSAAILSALGAAVMVIIGLNDVLAVIVSALFSILYTVIGGQYSVAYTDVIQLICIFVGLWICVPFALTNAKVSPISTTASEWLGELDKESAGIYLDNYMILLLGGIPWQSYFQRVLSCKTPKRAQILSLVGVVGCLIMCIPSILVGAIGRSADWSNTTFGRMPGSNGSYSEARLILPLVLQNFTPSFVSFIGLGAVSAAVLSSADSSILSSSSMFIKNIYKPLFRPTASERELVWVMKIAIVIVGALSAGMAIAVQSVYGLWFLCSDLVFCILFPQLVLVIFYDKVNTYGSLSGYVVGMILRLIGGEALIGLPPAVKYFWVAEEGDKFTQLFPFKTFAMLISFIIIFTVSNLARFLFVTKHCISLKYDVFQCFTTGFEKKVPDVIPIPANVYLNQGLMLDEATVPSNSNSEKVTSF